MVKKGRIVAFFLILIVAGTIIGLTATKLVNNVKLGLDLQGGFEVLYQVEPLENGPDITDETLSSAVSAINRRIDALGVSEPSITIEGDDHIRVALAGIKDQEEARKLLSTTAQLTFRNTNGKVMLDGSDLAPGEAQLSFDSQTNEPIVALELKSAKKFGNVTKKILNNSNVDNRLVIWMDKKKGQTFKEEVKKEGSAKGEPAYISAPTVNQVINSKDVQITGVTQEEGKHLASLLKAGSLPVKMTEIYSNSVGAQFGQNAMDKTILAGIIGIAAIFLFMLLFYRFGGLIAVLTLAVYMYLVLAVFVGLQAVLTLPGIAALILGVGMAVDANIITLERIKYEIRSGKSILSAFKSGSKRAFGTILDANLTTILAAAVMFVYGDSSVKGFAIMLIVSIVVSFITAVFGSRLLLGLWVNSRALNKKPGLFGVKKGDIDEL